MKDVSDVELVVALIVGSIAVGRATRLIVDDDMPLFKQVRELWTLRMPQPWNELAVCGFCVSVWVSIANTTWAFATDLHWTWWFLNIVLAAAYVGAMINVRDIPAS